MSENQVEVKRELDFWSETIELQGELQPAVTLTVHSSILYKGDLQQFYLNYLDRDTPENLLIGLKVRDRELGSYGTITQLPGTVGQHRDRLIKKATRESSKQSLRNAPDDQPIVTVQFKNRDQRDYPMVLLRPCVTVETADKFDVEWGKLLKATKISHKERTFFLASYKETVKDALAAYGFELERSINSRDYPSLFWQPKKPLQETPLLFGNGFVGKRDKFLAGLSEHNGGGVYKRHDDYRDRSRLIRIAALQICDLSVNSFLESIKQRLKSYGFNSDIVTIKALSVSNLSGTDARAEVDKAVDDLITVPPDIVLTFLPQSDRNTDDEEGGSQAIEIQEQINQYLKQLSLVQYGVNN
ncbi:hypothetical protein WA1_43850 [Scytonema hofmannii PCC 7110]|uniref:Uncharacterized protein n=1 Tax=Scytonema hofmannii PCC 7110 TaxID=128403 RepID=A0A139WW59_9CYAN|nr:hypothetical protein [Scytonema hofmannii]KYC36622.1 hypothetical protein WA1_43850 [Scytonema hofmannii PCC 7110]